MTLPYTWATHQSPKQLQLVSEFQYIKSNDYCEQATTNSKIKLNE